MSEFLSEFKSESLELVTQMLEILESCEAGALPPEKLEDFGQYADRIMGAAKMLVSMAGDQTGELGTIGQFTQICKLLGYKGAQIKADTGLWPVTIALLLDVSEELNRLIGMVGAADTNGNSKITSALLDRMQWLNKQFAEGLSGTVRLAGDKAVDSTQIEKLIQNLKK